VARDRITIARQHAQEEIVDRDDFEFSLKQWWRRGGLLGDLCYDKNRVLLFLLSNASF